MNEFPPVGPTRLDELREGLSATRQRIADATQQAGRPADAVTLVVVTKTYPAVDVVALAQLGVQLVGENRHPEAEQKRADVAAAGHFLRWHFIGGLQTNKAARVARYVDVVESVDRLELLDPLCRGARHRQSPLDCLLQVSLDAAPGRSGVPPEGLSSLAEAVAAREELRVAGVMVVAPLGQEPERAFAALPDLARTVAEVQPTARVISAGMSGDLEAAIAAGATHVRVGTSILGTRPTPR